MAAAPHRLAGIGLVLCSVLCFAALDTTTKWVSASVPVVMALFLRYLVQALGATVTLLPLRGLALLRTRHPRFHLARGLLLILSSALAFLSLSRLPVGEFTMVKITGHHGYDLLALPKGERPVAFKVARQAQ